MILTKIKRNLSRYDFREDTPTYLSISETIENRKEGNVLSSRNCLRYSYYLLLLPFFYHAYPY